MPKFEFDTFEFVGLIAPGGMVLLAFAALHPDLLRLGDPAVVIGMLILLAYVVGNLIAAIGNAAEDLHLWECLGIKKLEALSNDDWIEKRYISQDQLEPLKQLVRHRLHRYDLGNKGSSQRKTATRQIMLLVLGLRYPGRVETFSGMLSLSRGLTISFIASAILALVAHQYLAAALCIGAMALAVYRMWKFEASYSRELLQRFLLLSESDPSAPQGT